MSSLSPRPRLRHAAFALVLFLSFAALPARTSAQYMYLDSNGDGLNTAADVVNPTGTTTIDVYLITDQNADGSEAICQDGEGLSIFSYTVTLRASEGGVAWGTPLNRMLDFGVSLGLQSNSTELFFGKGGSTPLAPGKYRLMTAVATVVSGSPGIQIVAGALTLSGFTRTSFGSMCVGSDFDNTLKLGSDWFDVAGLPIGVPGPPNSPPVLSEIEDMSIGTGEIFSRLVTATDPDNQTLRISKLDGPDFMFVTSLSEERGSASARITAEPVHADIGSSVGTVGVTDGEITSSRTFGISVVAGSDHPTDLAPIGALSVAAGRVRTEPIVASDPDGEQLSITKVSGPPFLTVMSFDSGSFTVGGLLRLAPTICDAGPYNAIIAAGNGVLSDQEAVHVEVELPLALGDLERRFAAGGVPSDFAVSDFNRDGHLDIAAVSEHPPIITVLLGDGGGSFGSRIDVPTVGDPLRILVGDWNKDGAPDLGALDAADDQLSTYLGRGDGSFTTGVTMPTGGMPQDALSADLNDDGLIDLVAANSSASFVSVFLGIGGGAFAPRVDIPTPATAFCVAAADLNGDGRLDIAVGSFAQRSVSIHLGHGDGTFRNATVVSVPAVPYTISAADLNEDGAADLVVTDYDGAVVMLLGIGNGGFTPGIPITGFGASPTSALSDVNTDGHVDVVIVGPENDGATALFGDGAGAFPTRAQISPSGALRVALADVNGDAIPDLILPGGASVLIRLNTIGAGTAVEARAFLKDPNRTRPGAGGSPFCLRVEPVSESYANADLNYSSLALISEGTGSVSRITAIPAKNIIEGDTDGNGVPELAVCFSGADVSKLFDQVAGRRTVHVNLEGAVTNGRRFCSGFDMTVTGTGGNLATTVTPNPLNPSGVLTFRTARDGYVRVRMFDLNGRLVRVLADHPLATAGDQEIRIDGRGANGETLASGAYFYVVETPEGKTRGRIMILK